MLPPVPDYPSRPAVTASTYASFWRRAVASLLDSLLLGIGLSVLLGVLDGATDNPAGIVLLLIPALVPWMYKISLEASGATLGKAMLGLRVVDANGGDPGPKRALVRALLPIVLSSAWLFAQIVLEFADSAVIRNHVLEAIVVFAILALSGLVVGMLDVLWVVWDDRNQALRDKIAGTYVIRG